jgi:hypothetical protein
MRGARDRSRSAQGPLSLGAQRERIVVRNRAAARGRQGDGAASLGAGGTSGVTRRGRRIDHLRFNIAKEGGKDKVLAPSHKPFSVSGDGISLRVNAHLRQRGNGFRLLIGVPVRPTFHMQPCMPDGLEAEGKEGFGTVIPAASKAPLGGGR